MFKLAVVCGLICATLALPQQADPKLAQTLKSANDISPDGYQYSYETSGGISAEETGKLVVGSDNVFKSVQGRYSYPSDDNQQIELTYVADENGFQPQGPHLPTIPPIPEAILKALKYIAEHPPPKEN
ncbi:larval cuticle protein LCP-17-like [Cylas formicarius]|uniref:larval cuticle protein LCP-17-like n=1 Tax=Cylas formicarius TaxID=197179 RepID=UPI002958ADFD|nr:larval cuticle protein LCP-17-like [Cylas formicarius]